MAVTKQQRALRHVLARFRAEQPELYERWLQEALAAEPDAPDVPDHLELVCAGCGEKFKWGPRRKYCEDCGRRAAVNDASRRYRQRKKEQQL